ncbi:MAG: starch-binding protein [Clostridia bacterium]|nr:starch-binding protein [Clostridia bacterium]
MKKSNMSRKQILMSIAALMLVLITAVSFTYSWVEGGNKGYVNGNEIQINSDSSLTMVYGNSNTSSIILPTCKLQEVSSANGKNFFFPTPDNTSSTTADMTFREGTMQDVNTKYISLDFDLIAGDSATDVYLGAGTIVQCSNDAVVKALRMAFFTNDGEILSIFKPNQMPGVDMPYHPIIGISDAGKPTTTTINTEAYGDYYFKGEGNSTPLFHIEKGETKKVTLAIWLEGTAFNGNTIANSDLSIYIDFTTTVDDLVKYNFIDNTHGYDGANPEYWVTDKMKNGGSDYETMMYIFDNASQRYYAMEKSKNYSTDHTWFAYIPKNIADFSFRRYSIDIDKYWNEWNPSMTDIKTDPNGERSFVAICGNPEDNEGTTISGCYGYWKDRYGTFRIYFEMQTPYSNLHCYAWDTSDKACAATGTWPGAEMTFVKNTDNGVLYYIDLKETENIAGIQFNNGGETRVYLEGFDYGINTAAYVHFTDADGNKKEPLGKWDASVAGTKATYDSNNTVGKYWVDFSTSASNHGRAFYIIANNWNNGSQFPQSGDGAEGGKLGRVYRFTNGNTTLERLAGPYDITGDDLNNKIFNGAAFWLQADGSHGFYVYTGKEDSLILPH